MQRVCLIRSGGPAVAVTDDAVLVVNRDEAHRVRELVEEVRASDAAPVERHRENHRPWRHYRLLDTGARHQVKRIVVETRRGPIVATPPPLQHHCHRAEHWVVVRGAARVTVDDEIRMLHENESVYIPLGLVHRMGNPGTTDLEIIEVQTGSDLGEDDIVGHEGIYARV